MKKEKKNRKTDGKEKEKKEEGKRKSMQRNQNHQQEVGIEAETNSLEDRSKYRYPRRSLSVNCSGPMPEQFGPLKYYPYPSLLPTNRPPLDLTNSLNAILGGCFAQFCLPSRSIPIT